MTGKGCCGMWNYGAESQRQQWQSPSKCASSVFFHCGFELKAVVMLDHGYRRLCCVSEGLQKDCV